jgi:hypothetical protein
MRRSHALRAYAQTETTQQTSAQRSHPQHEAIYVEECDGVPVRMVWRGRPLRVTRVVAFWCIEGRWWLEPWRAAPGVRRRYFRLELQTSDGTLFCAEVYRQGRAWHLWRVLD